MCWGSPEDCPCLDASVGVSCEGQDVEVLGDDAGRVDGLTVLVVRTGLDTALEDDLVALFADFGIGEALAQGLIEKCDRDPVRLGGPVVAVFDLTVRCDRDMGDFVLGIDVAPSRRCKHRLPGSGCGR